MKMKLISAFFNDRVCLTYILVSFSGTKRNAETVQASTFVR